MSSRINEKLRRVERIMADEEPVTQKQATLLTLDLFADFWGEIEEPIKMVKAHNDKLISLETRVRMGIGLTVIVGIAGGIGMFLL